MQENKNMEKRTYIKEWIKLKNTTITECAAKIGITQAALSLQIARPSYSSLCNIAIALNVEPWQLLAPPSVVEEVERARHVKDNDFAAYVRMHGKTYTPSTLEELAAVVDVLRNGKT